jgi:hypothetical protein
MNYWIYTRDYDEHKMESQQVTELLLAMREETRGNHAKTDAALHAIQKAWRNEGRPQGLAGQIGGR